MKSDFELDIFRTIQRRQRALVKIAVSSLAVSAALLALSAALGWPLFLSLIPIALIGPFVVNVAGARCPHCQRLVHRTFSDVLRSLDYCRRCGFPRRR
jgi:hypothetical protein